MSIPCVHDLPRTCPVNDPKEAGARLKEAIHVARARAKPPITSDSLLSIRAGVHYDTLMNWYAGRTMPSGDAMRRVADTLGVKYADLMDLYEGRDPEPPTLVQAIETLIVELRQARAEQAEATTAILRTLGAMLPELLAIRPRNGESETPRRR